MSTFAASISDNSSSASATAISPLWTNSSWAAVTGAVAVVGAVAAHDLTQRKHAILRNFPVVGHLRFALERFGPELRQYVVASNDEERPFNRDQRRWVYQRTDGCGDLRVRCAGSTESGLRGWGDRGDNQRDGLDRCRR